MKTRLSRVVALCLLLITAGLGFNSCMPETVEPTVNDAKFGSIRVMNFIDCAKPFDLYIYQEGSRDTVINRGLEYSVGSAYATNLNPGTYIVEATKLNQRDIRSGDLKRVNIGANESWSVIYFGDGSSGVNEISDVKIQQDKKLNAAGDRVYVRFLNTKQTPELEGARLSVDNPLNAPILSGLQPRQITDYVELGHALDTTYALYLLDRNDAVVARFAGAAFGPGQSYTVVYSGNYNECRDTLAEKLDTLRLRYFDDNEQGNDLTLPLVQSLRFNFINGLIPPANPAANQRTYATAGVVLNNDDRFLIPAIAPGDMARKLAPETDNVITGGFYTIAWTDAIQLAMYANVYNGDVKPENLTAQRGIKMADLRVGNRKQVKSDIPFSILVLDTVGNRAVNGAVLVDSSRVINWSVPLPDVPKPGVAQIVAVNALAPVVKEGTLQPSKFAKIYINGSVLKAFTTPQKSPKSDVTEVSAGGNVQVKVEIGKQDAVTETLTKDFTPVAGGIYEIVVVGQRNHPVDAYKPKIMIIHTNKASQ